MGESELTKQPTSSMHYVHILLEQIKSTGRDPNRILASLGISSSLIQHPARIETQKLAGLVQAVWGTLQDENLGFSRHPCKLGTFYWMGRVSVHEPTLGEALLLGIRYCLYSVEDYELELKVSGDVAYFLVRLKDPALDRYHALTELILMGWHRYGSWLIGQNVPIIESFFGYPKPNHWQEYKFIMPSLHRFDAGETGFCFAAHYLDCEVVQNTSDLKDFMSRCPADLFLRYREDESVTKKVRLMLEKIMGLEPLPPIQHIASLLNMAPETLRRKLKVEGMSYMAIKDLVRRDAAFYHLARSRVSVSEISELVGFSSPSVFSRAFKEWVGVTPQEFRQHHLN